MTTTLMTVAEVQREYRLGRDLVRRLIRDREIPAVVIGPRKVLLPRDGIEAWVKRNTVPATRRFFGSHLHAPRTI